MAFCADCGSALDLSHRFCPKCGSLVGSKSPPTVIEATGKRWKGLQLCSVLVVFLSLIFFVALTRAGEHTTASFVALAFIVGIVLFIYARVMAWWHHG